MQTTSVIFNTKLLLSPIHASNYYYNDKNSRYSPVIAHQCKKSSVTLRPHRRRCSRPYLINPQVCITITTVWPFLVDFKLHTTWD